VTILEPVELDEIFIGAACNAVCPTDGMWYEAVIERFLSDEEALEFAATDLRSSQPRMVVRYKAFGLKQTIPLDYVRLTEPQRQENRQLKSVAGEKPKEAQAVDQQVAIKFEKRKVGTSIVAKQLVTDFQFPEHLRSTKNDSEKVRE